MEVAGGLVIDDHTVGDETNEGLVQVFGRDGDLVPDGAVRIDFMADGIGKRRSLLVEVEHQFPARSDAAMGAVDINRVVVVGEDILEFDPLLSDMGPPWVHRCF